MGLFGTTNDAATEEVERATSEKLEEEDWQLIMNICDKAKNNEEAKNYLKAIYKRLNHPDPHIGLKAVTLLDACVKNCGKNFHIEVASREFEDNFTKLMTKGNKNVAKSLRLALKRWAENEFKNDPQLNLIPTLYSKLKNEGYDFNTSEMPQKKAAVSKDPNVVESQEEEEQIMKAIELSLKESSGSPRNTATASSAPASVSSSLYPSTNVATLPSAAPAPAKEPRKVRALYDFEAAEDNELTFSAGEIIFVVDDSDLNWWKGSNQRGEGLFPSNFVTSDLSAEPDKLLYEKVKKIVQFKETIDVKTLEQESEEVEINEDKIDRLLHLLHEADPTSTESDSNELLKLERECNAMQPLIDSELERVDRKHAQLTQLSSDLVDALGLYHTLMREPQVSQKLPYGAYSMSHVYNGTLPHTPMSMGMPMPTLSHERLRYYPTDMGMPPQQYQGPPMTLPRMGPMPPVGPPQQQQQQMGPYMGLPQGSESQYQSLPAYMMAPPNMPPNMNYQPQGPPGSMGSQTHLQNGPPQQQQQQQQPGGHYVSTSSSHIM